MCGIGGVVRRNGRIDAMDQVALARMMRAEAHRGPDDEGAFSASRVLLGHARLAVIDLSASARQPMPNETGDVWITFNGEIYNFEALRRELRASGHRFRSNSDFEVLLHGYESWGLEGLLPRLHGMFAFALYDARPLHERKLYLVRDRLGIKPLYYADSKDRLLFASELSAIVASGLIPATPAEAALTSFLALGSVPGPGTAVEGVFMLEPAHYMELSEGSRSFHRYWSLPAAAAAGNNNDNNGGRDDDIENVRGLLAESVRMRLVSDVPLGVFSSGGMDSATLVALAAKFSSEKVTTLSVVFDEPGLPVLNEARYARVVAKRYDTDHREIRLDGQDFLGALPDVFRAMDSPTVDGVNSFFVSRAAREAGLTVVLSGVGGDEVFLGYPHFRKLRALAPFVPWLERSPRFARRLLASFVSASAAWHSRGKLEYLESVNARNLYLLFRGLFSPGQINELLPGSEPYEIGGDLPSTLEDDDLLRSAMRLEFGSYLRHQLLRDTDVMSMTHSLEARVPFLDHALVEAVFRLPHHVKFSRGVNKPLLMRALDEPLPREVWDRPKQGFTLPFQSWLVDHREELAERALAPGIFESRAVERLWDAFARGRTHWSRPWALVAYSAWLERLQAIGAASRAECTAQKIRPVAWRAVGA